MECNKSNSNMDEETSEAPEKERYFDCASDSAGVSEYSKSIAVTITTFETNSKCEEKSVIPQPIIRGEKEKTVCKTKSQKRKSHTLDTTTEEELNNVDCSKRKCDTLVFTTFCCQNRKCKRSIFILSEEDIYTDHPNFVHCICQQTILPKC